MQNNSDVAFITGKDEKKTSLVVKSLMNYIDSGRFIGFASLQGYYESITRGEIYDRVIILDVAFSDSPESELKELKNFIESKSKFTDVVLISFLDTSSIKFTTFNKIFTNQKGAVYSASTESKKIQPDDILNARSMPLEDIIKKFPDANHKILSTDANNAVNPLALGYSLPDGAETGVLDEDIPPDDESDELPPDDSTDLPPEDSSDVSNEDVQEIIDSVDCELPESLSGVFMWSAMHREDTPASVAKVALSAYKAGNSVLVIDLTKNHDFIETFSDSPDYEDYAKGISQSPYQNMGINVLSLGDGTTEEFKSSMTLDTSQYKTVIYVLDFNTIGAFRYASKQNVSCEIILRQGDEEDMIRAFSDSTLATNNFALAYQNSGEVLYMGAHGQVPNYFVDRVDWFKSK
jgi:hypothetical protein